MGVKPLENEEFVNNPLHVNADNIQTSDKIAPILGLEQIVTHKEIMPLPKCKARRVVERRRRVQKSEILTYQLQLKMN